MPPAAVQTQNPIWKVSPSDGKYFINSVAVSADGARVLGGTFYHVYGATPAEPKSRGPAAGGGPSEQGTFGTYCYDASGAALWKNEFVGWQGVYWVALSADGSKAASGGSFSQTPAAGFVRAFDGATGKLLLDYPTQQRVNQVSLSADGTWLVSSAETLILFRFDAATGAYTKAAEITPSSTGNPTGYSPGIVSAQISADGATAVYADYLGHIVVLANAGGTLTPLASWLTPTSFSHMVALTPDGSAFAAGGASGSFYFCTTAQFIARKTPTYTYTTGLPDAVYGVAVAATGDVFAGVVNAGSDAGAVFVVRITDFAAALECKFPTLRNPNSASLNLAAGLLAVADGHPDGTPGNFYLYDGITGAGAAIVEPSPVWRFQAGNMSWPIVISARGNAVVAGSDDSNIYYFAP